MLNFERFLLFVILIASTEDLSSTIVDLNQGCGAALSAFSLAPEPHNHSNVVSDVKGIISKIWRTNRSVYEPDPVTSQTLRDIYPVAWFEDLDGLDVLDIGTGDGGFVLELNSGKLGKGTRGWGLDLVLDESQKKNPQFIQGASYQMPIKSGSVDRAFATLSFFQYIDKETPEGMELLRKSFAEIHRVLKPGGRLRMAYIRGSEIPLIRSNFPEFKLTVVPKGGQTFEGDTWYAVELKKKD